MAKPGPPRWQARVRGLVSFELLGGGTPPAGPLISGRGDATPAAFVEAKPGRPGRPGQGRSAVGSSPLPRHAVSAPRCVDEGRRDGGEAHGGSDVGGGVRSGLGGRRGGG